MEEMYGTLTSFAIRDYVGDMDKSTLDVRRMREMMPEEVREKYNIWLEILKPFDQVQKLEDGISEREQMMQKESF